MFSDAAARLAGLAGALLGWRPDEFWRATPAELAAVLGAIAGDEAEPASGVDLARLMAMYPDEAGEGPLHRASRGPPPRASSGRN